MDLGLESRICLVSGASAGIGRGVVKTLAQEGAQTIAVARRTNLLEELADEVAETGAPRPIVMAGDLSKADGPGEIAAQALDRFGRVDVVVNNAGQSLGTQWDAPDELWTGAFDLNFHAARRLTTALIPAMKANQWGRIVNITGGMEVGGLNAALTGKAATHLWAKGLSRALGRDAITVNCIIPGRINSEQILGRVHADPVERAAFIEREIPAGYFGDPEDLAVLVAFLASAQARYISGEVMRVDGGMYRYAH
jgi:3-oxoacyl-[acyl-carrier protein] reductase